MSVIIGIKFCKTFGNAYGKLYVVFVYVSLCALRIKVFEQLFHIGQISVLKYNTKFIATDSENGASFECIGNNTGNGYYELVSKDVTVCIIDFLEVIYVKHSNAE